MAIKRLVPTFWTDQLKETVDFYTNVLGFDCESMDLDYGWANLNRDKVNVMFALPNDHVNFEQPSFTGSIYLHADDVESEWLRLQDKAEICYPLEKFDYGMWEFAVYDNNGYMIQFGQEI